MFKRVAAFLAAAVLAFAIVGCSSPGSSGSSPAGAAQLEMLAISQGHNMVSDGEYFYFTDGGDTLYRADLNMGSVNVVEQVHDGRVFALCVAGDTLYYSAEACEEDGQGNGYHRKVIRRVGTDGKNPETLAYTSSAVKNVAMWQDMLVYTDKGEMKFIDPKSKVENTCAFNGKEIVYAQPTDEGVYFTMAEKSGDARKLCLFKGSMTKPDVTELADIGLCGTFALCGSDIYYLVESEDTGPGSDYYAIMKLDAQGNVTETGVTGIFSESSMYTDAPARLCGYGDFLFYSKNEIDDKKHTWEWQPYCYNTVTGQETVLEGYVRGKTNTQVSDVSEGYVFLRSVSTGVGKDWVQSLTDPDNRVELPAIIENAEQLGASKASGSASAASSSAGSAGNASAGSAGSAGASSASATSSSAGSAAASSSAAS